MAYTQSPSDRVPPCPPRCLLAWWTLGGPPWALAFAQTHFCELSYPSRFHSEQGRVSERLWLWHSLFLHRGALDCAVLASGGSTSDVCIDVAERQDVPIGVTKLLFSMPSFLPPKIEFPLPFPTVFFPPPNAVVPFSSFKGSLRGSLAVLFPGVLGASCLTPWLSGFAAAAA